MLIKPSSLAVDDLCVNLLAAMEEKNSGATPALPPPLHFRKEDSYARWVFRIKLYLHTVPLESSTATFLNILVDSGFDMVANLGLTP